MRSSSDQPLYWARTSVLSSPNEAENAEKLFPMVLEFQSLDIAIALAFSWAVLLQIYCSLIRIFELLQSNSIDASKLMESQQRGCNAPSPNHENHPPPLTPWPSLSFCRADAHSLSRLICQSLEYCHKFEMGMLGPQAITYPQWILRRYFRFHAGHEREFQWCRDFKNMRGPGHRCGVEMMMFTDNILGDPYFPSQQLHEK
jgi:hypothetical protein